MFKVWIAFVIAIIALSRANAEENARTEMVETLARGLDYPDWETRKAIVHRLTEFGPDAQAAQPILVDSIAFGPRNSVVASRRLHHCDLFLSKSQARDLITIVKNEEMPPWRRLEALIAIGQQHGRRTNESPAEPTDKFWDSLLKEMAGSTPTLASQLDIAQRWKAFDHLPPDHIVSLPFITFTMVDEKAHRLEDLYRVERLVLHYKLRGTQINKGLIAWLDHQDISVRAMAFETIAKMGKDAHFALPSLRRRWKLTQALEGGDNQYRYSTVDLNEDLPYVIGMIEGKEEPVEVEGFDPRFFDKRMKKLPRKPVEGDLFPSAPPPEDTDF